MASQADASPQPSASSSVLRDGAVSGVLPDAEAFSIHYPGYPSSPSRAVRTLGGLSEIAKVRSSESGCLELRFRPEDPYCHPTFGELRPTTSLLLRITKTKGWRQGEGAEEAEPQLSAEVVARVNQAYHFEGMVDYQHVIGVHAAKAGGKKRPWGSVEMPLKGCNGGLEIDGEDVMMLVPPLFSIKNKPTEIVLTPSAKAFSKSMQRGLVEHRWEMDVEPSLALSFDIQQIPIKINWEDHISKDSIEWECQTSVCKLFKERPIWPRRSLHERLLDDGAQVSDNQLRRLLFRAGYYFSTGPFGKFWIRRGYDPRGDPESRRYQKVDFRVPTELRNLGSIDNGIRCTRKWKDICRFNAIPNRCFVCLQLFELDDDFIQEEIKKPSDRTSCSSSTGWFSESRLKVLRLHVSIRFLSLYPKETAEDLLRSTRGLLERSTKEEALRKSQITHKEDNIDSNCSLEAPFVKSIEPEDQDGLDNCEAEDEANKDDESEGYASPEMAQGVSFPVDGGSYDLGESIPHDYLQEVLHSFPFDEDGENRRPNVADSSDGEFEIFEQDSEQDEDYSDGGDDGSS